MRTVLNLRTGKIIVAGITLLLLSSLLRPYIELIGQNVLEHVHYQNIKLVDKSVFTTSVHKRVEQSTGNPHKAVEESMAHNFAENGLSALPTDFLVLFMPSLSFDHLELLL